MNYMLMMQSQLPQILKESLFPSSLFVWDVLKPYIISIIVGGIFLVLTSDAGVQWSAGPAFLYYYINKAVMCHNPP